MRFLSVFLYVGISLVLGNLNYATKASKINKKPLKNNYQNDNYDEFVYACNKYDKDQICKCSNEVLNCEKEDLTGTEIYVRNPNFVAKEVNLKNNAIKVLEYKNIVPGLEYQIEVLDFSNNFISKIENGAFNLFTNLKVLHLSSNRLTTINSGFLTFKLGNSLHQLFLDGNQIKRIPVFAFAYLKNLKKLVLDENVGLKLNGRTFPAALGNLEVLSLDGCGIWDLGDDVFKRLVSLKQLSLRNNPITFVPKAINGIPNLFALDLSGTEITEFNTDRISADHNLAEIYISNMKYLYGIYNCSFCGLPNIQKVILSNNPQLYYFDENAFGSITYQKDKKYPIAALKEFDIRNCHFTTLPEKLFDWTKIDVLNIHGNPFICDSDLDWLTKNKNIHFENNPKCAAPESLKGIYFSNITGSIQDQSTSTLIPQKSAAETLNGLYSLKGGLAISLTVVGFIGLFVSAFILRRTRKTNVLHRRAAEAPPHSGYSIISTKQ